MSNLKKRRLHTGLKQIYSAICTQTQEEPPTAAMLNINNMKTLSPFTLLLISMTHGFLCWKCSSPAPMLPALIVHVHSPNFTNASDWNLAAGWMSVKKFRVLLMLKIKHSSTGKILVATVLLKWVKRGDPWVAQWFSTCLQPRAWS